MKSLFNKIIIVGGVFIASVGSVQAQELNSGYFTQDYKYRHHLNAAFDNDQGYYAFPILGGIGVKTQGNFGLGDLLFQDPATGYYNRTFMHPDVSVSDALSGLSSKNTVVGDVGLTLFSLGFNGMGGYNTIEVRSRTSFGVTLPYEFFAFAKDMRNKQYQFDNIAMNALSYAEVALGHSHQVNDQLRIGGKLKVLLGLGRADMKIDNMTATLEGDVWELRSGDASAEVSLKGIEFENTKDKYYNNGQPKVHVDLGETEVDGFGIGGFGLAVDLGAAYKVIDHLTLSAGLNDLGFINWSNNHLLQQKKSTFQFEGFHDIQVKDNSGKSFSDQVDEYSDQLSDFVNFENRGDQGSVSKSLHAVAMLGAEYELPTYDKLSFGLLGQHRFAGDFSWTEGTLSANWKPLNWLDGGVSLSVGTYAVSTGWILNIHPKGYNFFIGMDHILGKMSKEFIPLTSNASLSLGMAITWGGKKKPKRQPAVIIRQNQEEDTFVW